MASPSDKADFDRMRSDFLYFIQRTAFARLSSDLVLDRSADGTFGLPPKHDVEREGPIYIGWDFGSADGDVTVYGEHHPDGSLTITTIEKEPKA